MIIKVIKQKIEMKKQKTQKVQKSNNLFPKNYININYDNIEKLVLFYIKAHQQINHYS